MTIPSTSGLSASTFGDHSFRTHEWKGYSIMLYKTNADGEFVDSEGNACSRDEAAPRTRVVMRDGERTTVQDFFRFSIGAGMTQDLELPRDNYILKELILECDCLDTGMEAEEIVQNYPDIFSKSDIEEIERKEMKCADHAKKVRMIDLDVDRRRKEIAQSKQTHLFRIFSDFSRPIDKTKTDNLALAVIFAVMAGVEHGRKNPSDWTIWTSNEVYQLLPTFLQLATDEKYVDIWFDKIINEKDSDAIINHVFFALAKERGIIAYEDGKGYYAYFNKNRRQDNHFLGHTDEQMFQYLHSDKGLDTKRRIEQALYWVTYKTAWDTFCKNELRFFDNKAFTRSAPQKLKRTSGKQAVHTEQTEIETE